MGFKAMMASGSVVSELRKVYGSTTRSLIERLGTPSKRHYLRVNTLAISTGELLDLLKSNYSSYRFGVDEHYVDAIYIEVKGPFNVPIVDKKILVDCKAAESIILGANLYLPGVKEHDHFKKGDLVNAVAPGGEHVALCEAVVNSSELKSMGRGMVAKTITSKYKLPAIREMAEYSKGLFYPQSLPSIAVGHVIDPRPGELIVDYCAAPGGKTTHLIQLSRGSSRIVSIDRSTEKVVKIVETISRLRNPLNALIMPSDSRYLDIDHPFIRPDKALIDPPCTALGFRPKVCFNKSLRDALSLSEYQKQFISSAVKMLKPRGLLVYSTCTLTLVENEEVAQYAIKRGLEPLEISLPYSEKVYYGDVVAYRYSPLSHDMNGFFIAAFMKKA